MKCGNLLEVRSLPRPYQVVGIFDEYAVNSKDSLKDLVSLHPQIYILDRC